MSVVVSRVYTDKGIPQPSLFVLSYVAEESPPPGGFIADFNAEPGGGNLVQGKNLPGKFSPVRQFKLMLLFSDWKNHATSTISSRRWGGGS